MINQNKYKKRHTVLNMKHSSYGVTKVINQG